MEDYITVLRTASYRGAPPGFVTKVFPKPKGKGKDPRPMYFTSERFPFTVIENVFELIKSKQEDPRTCLISGYKREGKEEPHRRLASGDDPPCAAKPRRWVMHDLDDFPISRLGCTTTDHPKTIVAKFVLKYLPAIYHNVKHVVQLSASYGQEKSDEPVLSAHLFFLLDRMCTDAELKLHAWMINVSAQVLHYQEPSRKVVDPAINNSCVQEHFIAAPILMEGAAPPLPERVWLADGSDSEARISLWLDAHEGAYNTHLEQVGDDRSGFHEPLLRGIYHHIRQLGAPEYDARERLKEVCREAIDNAEARPGGVNPSRDDLWRYRSDPYLDQSIDGAVSKGAGKGAKGAPLSPEQLEEATSRFLYVQSRRKFFDTDKGHYSDPEDMRLMLGLQKDPTRSPAFLASLQRVDYVRAVPGQPQGFVQEERPTGGHWRVWNTWAGRLVDPTFGDATWFTWHVEQKICGGNLTAAAHVLDWIAHAIAKPGVKIRHALILGSSERGTGKSSLKRLLSKIIPDVKPLSNNDLKEKFRGYVPGAELAFAEEIRLNDVDAANSLKELITESPIHARIIHVGTELVNNFMNIMGTTNFRDPLHAHERERRVFFFYYDGPPDTEEYYTQFHWNIDNRASDVLGWALKRDLSRFDIYRPPPITEHAREMARLSRTSETLNVENAIRERTFPFLYPVSLASTVLDQANEHFRARFHSHQLKEMVERPDTGALWIANRRCPVPENKGGWGPRSFILFDEDHLKLQGMSGAELMKRVGKPRAELLKEAGLSPEELEEIKREEKAAADRHDLEQGFVPSKPNGHGNGHARHDGDGSPSGAY